MANHRPKQHTESVTFRLTPGEKTALEALAAARAKEAEAQGFESDSSAAAWLRWVIKREARIAGLTI